MKRSVYQALTALVSLAIILPSLIHVSIQDVSAAPFTANSAALVSGAYRIEVKQTAIVDEPVLIGLETSDPVVAMVMDVTNLGAPTVFDPSIVSLGNYDISPLQILEGTKGDPEASRKASIHATLSLDGNFPVAENSTIRLVVIAPSDNIDTTAPIGFRMGDQVMSIENTMVDSLDLAKLPPLQATMQLRVADVTGVPGSGKVTVAFRDGGTEDILIAGVTTPNMGTVAIPGCFANESSAAIISMSNRTVWLEEDGDGYLVWINNAAMGTFDLLNARLVQEGFGGSNGEGTSPYSSWLDASMKFASSQGTGLWTDCKTAAGDWKVAPTPAPEPTKTPEEIRAEYQWVDARDLIIRPGAFEGKKIVVQGSVFDISVERNLTVMQIWVSGGNYDNVIIAYYGDSTGIYEGTWITAYGEGKGTLSGTNAFGGTITVPMILADIVDH